MALSDWKFPTPVPFMEFAGTDIFKGGFRFGFQRDGNSWVNWQSGRVKTFLLADYMEPNPTEYDMETKEFTLVELPNGYKLKFKFATNTNPGYRYWWTRLYDENGSAIAAGYIPSITNYNNSGATAGFVMPESLCVKIGVYTTYPNEALPGYEPTNAGLWLFLGTNGTINLPEYGQVEQCTTFNQYDRLKAMVLFPVLLFNDIDAANNYIATHGNPVPPGTHFIGEEELPNNYDPSRPGGGDGNYSDNSDPIDFPDLPTGGALASGAIHAFAVNTNILTQLFQKLWSTSLFDMATWQKLVSSPLDCIISLHCLPVLPTLGGDRDIWFGNFNTELSSKIISNQYVTIDCGSLTLQKFFGSAMDFSPYTRVSIFLPFSGIHDLATEDVQGSTIHVKYHIDVLTGDCLIMVKCGQSVLYKFTGNMKMQIPITSRDDNALGNTIKGSLGMIGGAIIGGAVGSAPGAIAGATLSAAASVAMHKETISRSGEITSNTGLMDDFVPYLIIHRPQQSLAVNYNKFKGYPSNITAVLGSLTGYTEVEHIHLEGINGATDTELQEIEKLLKNGVII